LKEDSADFHLFPKDIKEFLMNLAGGIQINMGSLFMVVGGCDSSHWFLYVFYMMGCMAGGVW